MAIRFLKLRYSSRGWRQACARQFISSDILVGTSPPLVLLQTCTIGPPTNPLPIANLQGRIISRQAVTGFGDYQKNGPRPVLLRPGVW